MTAPAKTRHRRVVSLTAAALAMPAAIVATTGAERRPVSPRQAHWQPQIVTAAASGTQSQAVAARYIVAENAAESTCHVHSQPPPATARNLRRARAAGPDDSVGACYQCRIPEIHQIGASAPTR